MLIGVRGMPLGEHGHVGVADSRLGVGQVHVPWLIRFPGGAGRLVRTSALVSPLDLVPTIQEWIERAEAKERSSKCDGASTLALIEPASAPWRNALLCGATSGQRAFRTTGWSLRYEAERGAEGAELFVRPDDRWEANNVAALCPDIVEELRAASDKMVAGIQAGEPMPEERLPEKLRTVRD
jgi:arylsulfatase A-like enzyme